MRRPRIVVDPVITVSGDTNTTFIVRVIPSGPRDTIRSFGASPRQGLAWTAVDENRYAVTYTPFEHPVPYVVTFTAEGFGGTVAAEVRLRPAPATDPDPVAITPTTGLSIRLTISPPSYVLRDGRLDGDRPVPQYNVNVDHAIGTITLMNPRFPLYEIKPRAGATELIESVDLSEVFTRSDTAWINIDVLGLPGMSRAVRANPIQINRGDYRALSRLKPVGPPGNYRIELPREIGIVIDSVQLNNTMLPGHSVDFSLEAASTGFQYNRLTFYVHAR
jgi:hypothetical protein